MATAFRRRTKWLVFEWRSSVFRVKSEHHIFKLEEIKQWSSYSIGSKPSFCTTAYCFMYYANINDVKT